jgi:hypothetical protein
VSTWSSVVVVGSKEECESHAQTCAWREEMRIASSKIYLSK